MPLTTWTALRQHRYASWGPGKTAPSLLPDLSTFRRYCVSAARPATSPDTLRRIWTGATRYWAIPPEADPLALLARHPNTPPDLLAALAGAYPDEFLQNPVAPLLPLEDPAFIETLRDHARTPFYQSSAMSTRNLLRRAALPALYVRAFAEHPESDVRETARNHVALAGDWDPAGPEWRRALRRLLRQTPMPRDERDAIRELADYAAPDDGRAPLPGGLTVEAANAVRACLRHIDAGPTEGERTIRRYCRRNGVAAPPLLPLFHPADPTDTNRAYHLLFGSLASADRAAALYTLAHDATIPPDFLAYYGTREGMPALHPFAARNPAISPESREKILLCALRRTHRWPGIAGFMTGRGAGPRSLYWSLWESPDAFDLSSRFTRIGLALNPATPPAIRDFLAERDGDRLVRAAARALRQGIVVPDLF